MVTERVISKILEACIPDISLFRFICDSLQRSKDVDTLFNAF